MALSGTYTALITPFNEDFSIDWNALEKFVDFQIENGIDGLVPMGTTGESPTLSHDEHIEVIRRVTQWTKKKNPEAVIIAGTGSNSTREAVEMTRRAKEAGADYALVVNPYYNKPSQEGLIAHFTKIADEGGLPLILYNIPGRTCVKLELDTIIKLSEHTNIAGIKEATGDINFMTRIISNTREDFSLLSGDDNLLLPILSIGGRGVISVSSNLFPGEMTAITHQFLEGNFSQAQKDFLDIFPVCRSMFIETNPVPVKYAAFKMGLCKDVLRLPLVPLQEKNRSIIHEVLENYTNRNK